MGLDPGYRRLFIDYLKEYAKAENKTVFLTSHIISDMERLIDDCILMDYGRILLQRPVKDLLEHLRRYDFTTRGDESSFADDPGIYHPGIIRSRGELFSFEGRAYVESYLHRCGVAFEGLREESVCLEDAFIGLTGKY